MPDFNLKIFHLVYTHVNLAVGQMNLHHHCHYLTVGTAWWINSNGIITIMFHVQVVILVLLDASFSQSWFKYMLITFSFTGLIWWCYHSFTTFHNTVILFRYAISSHSQYLFMYKNNNSHNKSTDIITLTAISVTILQVHAIRNIWM